MNFMVNINFSNIVDRLYQAAENKNLDQEGQLQLGEDLRFFVKHLKTSPDETITNCCHLFLQEFQKYSIGQTEQLVQWIALNSYKETEGKIQGVYKSFHKIYHLFREKNSQNSDVGHPGHNALVPYQPNQPASLFDDIDLATLDYIDSAARSYIEKTHNISKISKFFATYLDILGLILATLDIKSINDFGTTSKENFKNTRNHAIKLIEKLTMTIQSDEDFVEKKVYKELCKNIQKVNFSGTSETNSFYITEEKLKFFPKLKKLNLENCKIDISTLKKSTQLKSLKMTQSHTIINSERYQIIFRIINDLSHLHNYNIPYLNKIFDKIKTEEIASFSSSLASLKTLHIYDRYNWFTGDFFTNLNFSESFSSLKKLHIALGKPLTHTNTLKSLSALQELLLPLIHDYSPLSNLKNLKVLYLFSLDRKDLSPLNSLTTVEDLLITNSTIDQHLSFLSKMESLKTLSLINCNVNDTSVLEQIPHLSTLFIRNSQISQYSLNSLLEKYCEES